MLKTIPVRVLSLCSAAALLCIGATPSLAAEAASPPGTPESSKTVAVPAPEPASEPFAWGDFTWLNGNNRQHSALLDSKYFTGSFLADVNYVWDFAHPIDHTIVGSTATFRAGEFNLSFLGFGGDFHWDNVRGRFIMQLGTRAMGIARNDPSADRGQFDLRDSLRYISEAYGGYHWDVLHGINLDV
ncbi:MAG TPA: outer membrane beta-barrel protein, partial [Myxococcales bacterium]|nr:outer membrane beta-barrel protein [Myxococcales bacterium]